MQGHVEEAKTVYREAAEVELDCVEAVYNLGLCHKRLGALGDALSSNFLPNNIEVLFQVVYRPLSAIWLVSSK
jgi:intraflagellar transport protein 88